MAFPQKVAGREPETFSLPPGERGSNRRYVAAAGGGARGGRAGRRGIERLRPATPGQQRSACERIAGGCIAGGDARRPWTSLACPPVDPSGRLSRLTGQPAGAMDGLLRVHLCIAGGDARRPWMPLAHPPVDPSGGGPWMASSAYTCASLEAMPVDRGHPWHVHRSTPADEGHGWPRPRTTKSSRRSRCRHRPPCAGGRDRCRALPAHRRR